jgi:hypothetical protein
VEEEATWTGMAGSRRSGDRDGGEEKARECGSEEEEKEKRDGGSEPPFLLCICLLCSTFTLRRRIGSRRAGPMGAWTCGRPPPLQLLPLCSGAWVACAQGRREQRRATTSSSSSPDVPPLPTTRPLPRHGSARRGAA